MKNIKTPTPIRVQNPKHKKIAKGILGGVIALLLVALGLEVSNTDYDVEKLLDGEGLAGSKIERAEDGTLLFGSCEEELYNCKDFAYQEDAQQRMEQCGGQSADVHRLDGDKDGIACEALPSQE